MLKVFGLFLLGQQSWQCSHRRSGAFTKTRQSCSSDPRTEALLAQQHQPPPALSARSTLSLGCFSELWSRCSFICIPGFLMCLRICFQGVFFSIAPSLSTLSPVVLRNRAVTRTLFKQTAPGESPSHEHSTFGERSGLSQNPCPLGNSYHFQARSIGRDNISVEQLIQFERLRSLSQEQTLPQA